MPDLVGVHLMSNNLLATDEVDPLPALAGQPKERRERVSHAMLEADRLQARRSALVAFSRANGVQQKNHRLKTLLTENLHECFLVKPGQTQNGRPLDGRHECS